MYIDKNIKTQIYLNKYNYSSFHTQHYLYKFSDFKTKKNNVISYAVHWN